MQMGAPREIPARASATDVARLAGVSQKTVSRVMNEEPHVRDEVRQRVTKAARQLGYRPNGAARSLNTGRTRRIGVVSLGEQLYGPSTMLIAVEHSARRMGFSFSVSYTREADEHGVAESIDSLLEQGVDGIVLSETVDEGPVRVSVDIPVLTLGRFPGLDAVRRIRTDDAPDRSGHLATSHLIGLGHTEIRHLAGPARWWASQDRAAGWRSALREQGLPEIEPLEGDWSADSGYRAGLTLARDRAMTAVFVANDEMAIGLIRALEDSGVRVPADVSVVGMDDIPAARYLRPSLTTIAQDFSGIAIEGMTLLGREIAEPGSSERSLAQPSRPLIVRESTAARP